MRIDDVQRRRGSLVQLVLDGEPAALIDRKTFEESPYEVGSSLSEEQWVALKKESKTRRAWDKTLYLLSLRDYARAQLHRKLEREAGSELARETVERLERAGLLNDGAYARRLARDMVERRHFSRRRTLQELTARGLDRETAEEAVEELEPDDAEQALELLRKKRYNELSDPDTRRRAASALARAGFGWDAVRCAMERRREELAEDETEDWKEIEQDPDPWSEDVSFWENEE